MNDTDIVFLNDLKSAVLQAIHQCNNHLSIILSNSELILAIQNPESTKKKTESTIARVALLSDLLTQLSQLFTVDHNSENVKLKKFFQHEVSHYAELARAEEIKVSANLKCDGDFSARTNLLKLLLHLLFRNAVSATKSSTTKEIIFFAETKGNQLTIEISNSGGAPEDLSPEYIFSSFFMSKKESTCDFLAAAKSLAQLLGGRLSFYRNENLNQVKAEILF